MSVLVRQSLQCLTDNVVYTMANYMANYMVNGMVNVKQWLVVVNGF
jgi:hypothetical protein